MIISDNLRSVADLGCLLIKTERDIAILTLKNMKFQKKIFKCDKKSNLQANCF